MPTERYKVQFKLEGGANVTKTILASSYSDAGKRARRTWRAVEIIKITKVS